MLDVTDAHIETQLTQLSIGLEAGYQLALDRGQSVERARALTLSD